MDDPMIFTTNMVYGGIRDKIKNSGGNDVVSNLVKIMQTKLINHLLSIENEIKYRMMCCKGKPLSLDEYESIPKLFLSDKMVYNNQTNLFSVNDKSKQAIIKCIEEKTNDFVQAFQKCCQKQYPQAKSLKNIMPELYSLRVEYVQCSLDDVTIQKKKFTSSLEQLHQLHLMQNYHSIIDDIAKLTFSSKNFSSIPPDYFDVKTLRYQINWI